MLEDMPGRFQHKGNSELFKIRIYLKIQIMHRALAFIVSAFILFTVLAETTHAHAQGAAAPCPAACLGTPCGSCSDDSALKSFVAPADTAKPVAPSFAPVFVARLSADEIFHPPLG